MQSQGLVERLNGKVCRTALLLAVIALVLPSFLPLMDNVDLGWHVAQGRWMVEHLAVYRRDVMNYANFLHPLVDEYPLFQVVLYGATLLGWWGPCLLSAVGYILLVAMPIRSARRWRLLGSPLLPLSLAAMMMLLHMATPLRPHLVTYVCVMALGVFLLRHRNAASWVEFWPMGLMQIAWTNCHSGFVLGPAMVGLFGLEMVARSAISRRAFPWREAEIWLGAFVMIFIACLVNPFGWTRFYPAFFQDRLEAIRAYVLEMEPLSGVSAWWCDALALIAAVSVLAACVRRGGALAYSFLFLAVLFFFESLQVRKAWPIFGLFPVLLILSAGSFAPPRLNNPRRGWIGLMGGFCTAAFFGIYIIAFGASLPTAWAEYDLGRSELPFQAIDWMKAHGIAGPLLHRCEYGGRLQEEGYDHGETFGDTGFGKYDEAEIHLVALLSERPALLPHYLDNWQPSFVVCGNEAYEWPYYLRQCGWRLIYYSPNGSVWAQSSTRPDLPTVTDDEVKASFNRDLAHGRPGNLILFGRNLLALNSLGLEDFAFAQLIGLPAEMHGQNWYWEAAYILCFETPPFSADHRHQLLAEAERLNSPVLTAQFRAYTHEAENDAPGARAILESIPEGDFGDKALDLLLKLDLAASRPGVLALAERADGFDLRDGWHWAYLAQAEDRAGQTGKARAAWEKAVFYYPDDSDLARQAAQFAAKTHDAGLQRDLELDLTPQNGKSENSQ